MTFNHKSSKLEQIITDSSVREITATIHFSILNFSLADRCVLHIIIKNIFSRMWHSKVKLYSNHFSINIQ